MCPTTPASPEKRTERFSFRLLGSAFIILEHEDEKMLPAYIQIKMDTKIPNDAHLDRPSSLELAPTWRSHYVASYLCTGSRKTISCEDQKAK